MFQELEASDATQKRRHSGTDINGTQAPAAAAQFAVGRRLFYTIRFDGEASIRLPRNGQDGIDNDDDVTYSQA